MSIDAATHFDIVLESQSVGHWFGAKRVLHDVNLKIVHGQIVSLVGPSGCGKSTLLRAILGTHPPLAGVIRVQGREVQTPGRDRGMVYQRYSLFPFLTAEENVAFGLMLDQTSLANRFCQPFKWRKMRKRHLEEASELLDKLGLGQSIHHYPAEMSGGMCQRVAIAQALIMKPKILLLDEPFGALDEATREELQIMLLELYQENLDAKKLGEDPPYTIMIVTHELNEALYVADRIIALSQYWDWRAEDLPEHPGATVIYDAVAPVYHPSEPVNHEHFEEQRAELRRAAFENGKNPGRYEHRRFWDECAAGKAGGVLAP